MMDPPLGMWGTAYLVMKLGGSASNRHIRRRASSQSPVDVGLHGEVELLGGHIGDIGNGVLCRNHEHLDTNRKKFRHHSP